MRRFVLRFGGDQRGVAAVELALIGGFFMVGAMNASEIGRYAYQASEVTAAAQAAAEAAYNACDLAHTPATLNCAGLTGAVNTALQGTPLGDSLTLDGPITEAYYCLSSTGVLTHVGGANAEPSNCSSVSNPTAAPTLYLQIHVTYSYQPIFPGLTLAQSFAPHITRVAWMRMA